MKSGFHTVLGLSIIAGMFILTPLQAESWFDGVPQEGLDWVSRQVKEAELYFDTPLEKSRIFNGGPTGRVRIRFTFQPSFGDPEYPEYHEYTPASYKVRITELDENGSSRTREFSSESAIRRALRDATSWEDFLSRLEAESPSTIVTPGASLQGDSKKSPLISSETPVATADKTGIRLLQNVVIPTAQTREQKEKAAELAFSKPRLIGGNLSFEDFKFHDLKGETYEILLGFEQGSEAISSGVFLPMSYVTTDAGDWSRLGATGFMKRNFNGDAVDSSLGINVNLEQTWMDISGIDDSLGYGVGPMGSISFQIREIQVGFGANYLYMKNTEYDSVEILSAGCNLGIPIGRNFVLNIYSYRTENLDSANDYWNHGGGATYMVSDLFGVTFGGNRVSGLDHFSSKTFHLGGSWRY